MIAQALASGADEPRPFFAGDHAVAEDGFDSSHQADGSAVDSVFLGDLFGELIVTNLGLEIDRPDV